MAGSSGQPEPGSITGTSVGAGPARSRATRAGFPLPRRPLDDYHVGIAAEPGDVDLQRLGGRMVPGVPGYRGRTDSCDRTPGRPMYRKLGLIMLTSVAMALALPTTASAQTEPLSGAIFTTDVTGVPVNLNHYAAKQDVYLNGGPGINAPDDAAGLPAGTYSFQVTSPSGKTLLSTDPVSCRQFTVDASGVIQSVAPGGGRSPPARATPRVAGRPGTLTSARTARSGRRRSWSAWPRPRRSGRPGCPAWPGRPASPSQARSRGPA